MSGGRRLCSYLACAAVVGSLAACGGSTPSQPTPTPTPAPTPQVVVQGGDTLKASEVGLLPITTARTGAIEVTVDWTFATNDIDVALARGSCSFDQLVAQQCTIAAISASTTAKPEKIRADNAAAGTYTLFIENTGPGDESLSFQVVLTPSATGAATPSASSLRVTPSLGQKQKPHGVVHLH